METMFHIYNIKEGKMKKKQTNLNLQETTNHKLKEISKGLGIPQNIIVDSLIDNYYINTFQQRNDTDNMFSLFQS